MNKKVMIVDDSVTMRQMVAFTLKEAGFSVAQAGNGQEALDVLAGHQVDLVIADINMPVMDGLTMIERLRQRPDYRFVPILVLTTESGDEMKQRGRAVGATGWIVKPFQPQRLQQVICRLLQVPESDASRT